MNSRMFGNLGFVLICVLEAGPKDQDDLRTGTANPNTGLPIWFT